LAMLNVAIGQLYYITGLRFVILFGTN
jgi:hypothetical protein